MPHISVVAPVYKSKACIEPLLFEIHKYVSSLTDSYEIILVDDGCPDGSWEEMELLSKKNKNIKFIKLSRNFGQHYAITAGIDTATGEWLFILDADLEDHPKNFLNMYKKAQEGWDIVSVLKQNKTHSFTKKIFSSAFYFVFSKISANPYKKKITNFSLLHKKVYEKIKLYRELLRSYPVLLNMIGFKHITIELQHETRYAGESSYGFFQQVHLAVHSIFAYSSTLLKCLSILGFLISLISISFGCFFITRQVFFGQSVSGWTSLIVSIFFSTGLIMLGIGTLGVYIGYIFQESKKRPLYHIDRIIEK